MILAAYIVTGMLIASVYAVGDAEGKARSPPPARPADTTDHRADAPPMQFLVGDTAARAVADNQPAKFAGMECIHKTGSDQTEYLGGICTTRGSRGRSQSPASTRSWSAFAPHQGHRSRRLPAQDRPPANTLLHLSFDFMVGVGSAFIALGAWLRLRLVAAARYPEDRLVPANHLGLWRGRGAHPVVRAGSCTEVGRQPWIVQGYMRTATPSRPARVVWYSFVGVLLLYASSVPSRS